MKVLKIVFISMVILFTVTVAGVVIFIKTFDVNRLKPQIIEQANKALGREVDFEQANLAISLRQGISLKINNLTVADDSAFAKQDFLSVKNISVGVDVLGYILQKQVSISSMFIDSPKLTLIRDKDGMLNAQTITSQGGVQKEKATAASAQTAMPALLISSLKGTSGSVTFIDRSFEPALKLQVTKLDFTVSKISLAEAFPFVVEAAVLSAQQNVKIEGKVQLDLKTNQISIFDLRGTTELSQILLAKIPEYFPMAKDAVLPQSLQGKIDVAVKNLTAGPKGLTALSADASLTDGVVQLKELASSVKDAGFNVKITQDEVLVDKLTASIGQGIVTASGAIKDYLAGQDYNFYLNIEDMDLTQLITQDILPVKTEGIVAGQVRIGGKGFSPQSLKSSLSGDANISLTKVKLKDLNVLRTVLDKISVLPGLAQKIEAGLPERFKQKLMQKDTVLWDIKIPVTIENGKLLVRDTALGADEFLFKGGGKVSFDGEYSLEGSFFIPQDLSQAMVAQVGQLQYLLNSANQIYIPLKVSGSARELKFSVDADYIAKRLLAEQGTKQLFKAFDKALGIKKEPQAQNQGKDQEQEEGVEEGEEEESSPEEAIKNLLRGIFK